MATTVADADVLITSDVSKFASDLKKKLDPIVRAINATLDVLADATQFNRTVDEVVKEADTKNATIKVGADTSTIDTDIRAVQAEINRRSATIDVDVDVDKNFDRIQGSFAKTFDRIGGSSGKTFASSMTSSLESGLEPLTTLLPKALSDPVVLGVATIITALLAIPTFALIAAGALTGIGLGFLGLGAFALKGNKEVSDAFSQMKDTITSTFTDAAQPLVEPLVKAFGIIGDTVQKIGPQLKDAFGTLAPQIDNIAKGLSGFIENVMPGLIDAFKASAPLLEEFAKQLPGLGTALGDFFKILALGGPDSVDALKVAFGLLKIVLIAVASTILGLTLAFGLLVDAGRLIVGLLNDLFTTLTGLDFGTAFTLVKQFATDAIVAIGDFISGAINFFSQLPGIFTSFISNAVNGAITFLTEGISALVGLASSLPGQLYSVIVGFIDQLGSIFQQAVSFAYSVFTSGISSLVSLAESIPGRILNVLGNLGGILISAGRSIIDGLIRGINDRIGALRSALSAITSLIPKIKGPEDVDKKLLTPAGQFIMQGLIAGIDDGISALERKLQGVTSLFSPAIQAGAPQALSSTVPVGQTITTAGSSTTSNNRTFSPVINVTVGSTDPDATANAIVRRLLAVGV